MDRVIVVGGGIVGLVQAMLLAREGLRVTVLERDPEDPPAGLDEAFERWDRPGVAQFRQPHNLHARCRHILQSELPGALDLLQQSGALRLDPLDMMPPMIEDRAGRPGDDKFWTSTGRRPFVEWVLGSLAARTPRVEVVRGVRVTGLLTGRRVLAESPHATGVRTAEHGELSADLVVDASGRRSALPDWIVHAGGRRPREEAEDSGFVYYTRYFRGDGTLPQPMAPLLSHFATYSILTLPADNGHWSVTVFGSGRRTELKSLRDIDRMTRLMGSHPLHAHWLDGVPTASVPPMAGIVDRWRRFVHDGRPSATGVVAVGDAWACTNPSAGRGIAVGMLHAVALRDTVRIHGDDPGKLVLAFDEVTQAEATPWYRLQVAMDRARLAQIEALAEGRPVPEPDGTRARLLAALLSAMPFDPELYRGFVEMFVCLVLPGDLFARPGFAERTLDVASRVEPVELPGPSPTELAALLS